MNPGAVRAWLGDASYRQRQVPFDILRMRHQAIRAIFGEAERACVHSIAVRIAQVDYWHIDDACRAAAVRFGGDVGGRKPRR